MLVVKGTWHDWRLCSLPRTAAHAHRSGAHFCGHFLRKVHSLLFFSFSFLRSGSSWLASCRDGSSGYTGLHLASLHGHTALVRALLHSCTGQEQSLLLGARDRRGCLPLHLAAWNGHASTVQQLLEPDPTCQTINVQNNAKETALHLAAQHGHSRLVAILLQVA